MGNALRKPQDDPSFGPASWGRRETTLITAVRHRDVQTAQRLIAEGVDVNEVDADGMTALHHAAAIRERPCLRLLVNCGRCDYLIRDKEGRYATELAYLYGADCGVGLLLSKKQAMQAFLQGVPAYEKSL